MKNYAHRIENDLYRLRLDSESGLVVNAYLLASDDALVLFDSGFPFTIDALRRGIEQTGHALEDIEHVFYTHTHIDHMGGGAALGPEICAQQHFWNGTPAEAYDDYFDWYARHRDPSETFRALLPDSTLTQRMLASIGQQPDNNRREGHGALHNVVVHDFGDVVDVGEHRFRCIDLRGHDPFHCGWLDETTGDAYCGDAIMRVISPIMPHMDDDLGRWLATIQSFRQEPVTRLLPGHGMPSTLIDASIDRSESFIKTLYGHAKDAFDDGLPVDPAEVAESYLGESRTRYHARLVVYTGTTYSIFAALGEMGLIQQMPSRHWTTNRTLPSYATFRDGLIQRLGDT